MSKDLHSLPWLSLKPQIVQTFHKHTTRTASRIINALIWFRLQNLCHKGNHGPVGVEFLRSVACVICKLAYKVLVCLSHFISRARRKRKIVLREILNQSGDDMIRHLCLVRPAILGTEYAIKTSNNEKTITQEMRQLAYDNWETTDDHGMQIYGMAKDQHGKEYFMMKNSWGENGPYKGFWYVSKPYAAYKTMNIVINKNAVPADIRAKLGI